ncbi:calcium-binding protein, partial [Phenylobacterium sp.]|uniref:calcium-binding protein n=1 Tax=Phenylobacterium sp. TaxID=1871053 RepID=UPI002736776F
NATGGDVLLGGQNNDVIAGNGGADTLNGNEGDDNITGGAGVDTIFGEDGDDVIVSAAGYDSVTGGAGDDNITLGNGGAGPGADVAVGGTGDDTITGGGDTASAANISGDDGGDILTGGAARDTISGGAGNDTISGAGGKDQLTGGAGQDRFVFGASDSGSTVGSFDLINDWEATDRLDFAAAGVTYTESTQADFATAETFANGIIGAGTADVVAVQVGSDVVVFVDTGANNGTYEDAVVLVGRTINDISDTNIV